MIPVGKPSGMDAALPPDSKLDPKDKRDPRLLEASRMYEHYFLGEMVKAMRQTVPESEFVPTSMGEKIFREQLDDQIVDTWTNQGGVGFGDLIYNNISETYGPQNNWTKPKGPLPLNHQEKFKLQVPKDHGASLTMPVRLPFRLEKPDSQKGPTELLSPWSGRVVQAGGLNQNGQSTVLVDHDNGFRSTLLFQGTTSIKPGEQVSAGQRLAIASPDQRSFYWMLEKEKNSQTNDV